MFYIRELAKFSLLSYSPDKVLAKFFLIPYTLYLNPKYTFIGPADFLPGVVCDCGLTTEIGDLYQQRDLPAGEATTSSNEEVEVMVRPDDVKLIPSPQGQGRIISKIFPPQLRR